MTSKEALEFVGKYLESLETLEILIKYVYFDEKDNLIKMNPVRSCKTNFDFEILKEWIENEKADC